jgi:hypothetical protein
LAVAGGGGGSWGQWQKVAVTGGGRQAVVGSGKRWQAVVGSDRRWQWQEVAGSWGAVTEGGSDKRWQAVRAVPEGGRQLGQAVGAVTPENSSAVEAKMGTTGGRRVPGSGQ